MLLALVTPRRRAPTARGQRCGRGAPPVVARVAEGRAGARPAHRASRAEDASLREALRPGGARSHAMRSTHGAGPACRLLLARRTVSADLGAKTVVQQDRPAHGRRRHDGRQPGGMAVVRCPGVAWAPPTRSSRAPRAVPAAVAWTARAGADPGDGRSADRRLLGHRDLRAARTAARADGGPDRGAQRIGPERVRLPEEKRALLQKPDGVRDGRRLLLGAAHDDSATRSGAGRFRPPVSAAPPLDSFGRAARLRRRLAGRDDDGRRSRRLPPRPRLSTCAAGTVVLAPAAGTVLIAEPLLLTGSRRW